MEIHVRAPRLFILMICVTAFAARAAALQPQEVLVVANAAVPESVALAEHYAEVRQIPPENIVLLRTAAGYQIPRDAYDRTIRQPLLEAINSRTDLPPIRCICLMWGVPVRISQPPPQPSEAAQLFRVEAERSHNRLAIARQLLLTVGEQFPAPLDDNSLRLADLFETPLPPAPNSLLSVNRLEGDIERQLERRAVLAISLLDADQRAIAIRQLMALQMEIYGLGGLIPYVEEVYQDDVDEAGLAAYRLAMEEAMAELTRLTQAEQSVDNARALLAAMQRAGGTLLVATHTASQNRAMTPTMMDTAEASVDSELAMIWTDSDDYAGPAANPLFWQAQTQAGGQTPTMMTARIDGPSAEDARNIIDNSIAAEQTGLRGKFYVDAGMPDHFANASGNVYSQFDTYLRRVGDDIRTAANLDVVIDTNPGVFPPGTAPDAALYVGWYSLRQYVPAFTWQRGAVAYHVASFEAMHLRDPDSDEWCPKLIQNGVVATIGAVREPTIGHFPDHTGFFLLLLTGDYTIAECYWRTIPAASWQMTLIADPLYNPFRADPKVLASVLDRRLLPPDNWPPIYQHMEVEQPNADDLLEEINGSADHPANQPQTDPLDDGEGQ